MLRQVHPSDLFQINEIWSKHHSESFGIFNENKTVGSAVWTDPDNESKLQAYGQVKLLGEASIVLDMALSTRQRVLAIQNLLMHAIEGSRRSGLEQLHVFIENRDYAALLEKHFRFQRIRDVPLVLNL